MKKLLLYSALLPLLIFGVFVLTHEIYNEGNGAVFAQDSEEDDSDEDEG